MKKSKITIKISIASIEKSAMQYIKGGVSQNRDVDVLTNPLYEPTSGHAHNPIY